MDGYLFHRLDQFLQRHPSVMTLLVITAIVMAALTLMTAGRAIVVYEGF